MKTVELIRDLFRHMEWADAIIWKSILSSESAQSDPGIRDRMQHLHLAQRAFLNMWRGEPIAFSEHSTSMELLPWGIEYHVLVSQFMDRVKPDTLEELVQIPWRKTAEGGPTPQDTSLQETMFQVLMHSMHHRGQVAARLKELEIPVPVVDYIAWVWSGRPAAAWPPLTVG